MTNLRFNKNIINFYLFSSFIHHYLINQHICNNFENCKNRRLYSLHWLTWWWVDAPLATDPATSVSWPFPEATICARARSPWLWDSTWGRAAICLKRRTTIWREYKAVVVTRPEFRCCFLYFKLL